MLRRQVALIIGAGRGVGANVGARFAKEGFAALQNEAESICNEAPKFCKCAGVTWPCPCGDAFQEKAFLDKAGWDERQGERDVHEQDEQSEQASP